MSNRSCPSWDCTLSAGAPGDSAGVFGLVVIGAISFMIPRVGVAAAVITIVAGQLFVSAALDHFGWLGAAERALDAPRLLGLGVVLFGVWLTVK